MLIVFFSFLLIFSDFPIFWNVFSCFLLVGDKFVTPVALKSCKFTPLEAWVRQICRTRRSKIGQGAVFLGIVLDACELFSFVFGCFILFPIVFKDVLRFSNYCVICFALLFMKRHNVVWCYNLLNGFPWFCNVVCCCVLFTFCIILCGFIVLYGCVFCFFDRLVEISINISWNRQVRK